MNADDLINLATEFYLSSRDFNGYSGHYIRSQHGLDDEEIRSLFEELVSCGRGALVFGDRHPNPHIRACADEPRESQLEKLPRADLTHVCLYPSASHLSQVVDRTAYEKRPYTLELALGAANLEFRVFDLSVLEIYRNDPRYYYTNDDIRGQICVSGEFYESDKMPTRDKVILETFGFAYDDDLNRAVAVFCIYLNRLSPEHQQIWKSKEMTGDYRLHPDYFGNAILGDWGERVSIFNAFIEEIGIVNEMCILMGYPHLFNEDFGQNKPRNFSFLVRPTQQEFHDFVLTLDKMMSDNVNKRFFMNEVADEYEENREDGKIVVKPKGTIAMLDEWLSAHFHPDDPKPMEMMVQAFKRVRKLRQKPAHSVKPDTFDQKFFHDQRQIVIEAYNAIRTIRLVFANHPAVRAAHLKIPQHLYEGEIWTR